MGCQGLDAFSSGSFFPDNFYTSGSSVFAFGMPLQAGMGTAYRAVGRRLGSRSYRSMFALRTSLALP